MVEHLMWVLPYPLSWYEGLSDRELNAVYWKYWYPKIYDELIRRDTEKTLRRLENKSKMEDDLEWKNY